MREHCKCLPERSDLDRPVKGSDVQSLRDRTSPILRRSRVARDPEPSENQARTGPDKKNAPENIK